jgi:hypothetical protein
MKGPLESITRLARGAFLVTLSSHATNTHFWTTHSGNFGISGLSIQEFILDNDISRIGSRISSIYMLRTDLVKM